MKSILWIMNFIAKKYSYIFPDTFISLYSLHLSSSPISFYKHYILNKTIYNENQQKIIEQIYFESKRIMNAFKHFFYLIKINKATDSNLEFDLYYNNLSNFPDNQKIILYISKDNTLYNFRISNLISSWLDSLTKNDGLFIKPNEIKNPYTNVPFEEHNLYNIYFAIKNSSFNMDLFILKFFKSGFIISKFVYDNYPILKDKAITNFIKHGTISELFEEINNMLCEFENEIDYVFLPPTISYRRKSFFVTELVTCIHYYCIHAFSCNPLYKRDAYSKCKDKLIEYFKNNDNSPFIRRRRPIETPLLPPQIILPSQFNSIPLTDEQPPVYFDEENDIDIQSISSDDSALTTILENYNPFSPTIQLPRTPTSLNIVSDSILSSPYNMRLFR